MFCAVTAECSWYQWHYANVDGPQRALSAVGHKAANHLPNKETPALTATGELDMPV